MKKLTSKISISLILVATMILMTMPNNTFAMSATYTVEFNSNGGTAVQTQTVIEDQKATEPDKPTKSGQTFVGWYDSTLTTKFNFNTEITDNITLYAKWVTTKDVWIDNTVDRSTSFVVGKVEVKNNKTGEISTEEVYNNSFLATFSNPKTSEVESAIDDAYNLAYNKAKEKSSEVYMETVESNGTVWDNRKYETIEDGDAVLIGDADYLTGAYGAGDEYTRTHVASGDYGKNTYFIVTASVEISDEEESETVLEDDTTKSEGYSILSGADQEHIIGSNTDLTVKASGSVEQFVELKVDNQSVDRSIYRIESGSTIATLKSSYLDSLSIGTHDLTFVYEDGEVSTSFKVAEATNKKDKAEKKSHNPKTGDSVILYAIIFAIAFVGGAITIIIYKNSRKSK